MNLKGAQSPFVRAERLAKGYPDAAARDAISNEVDRVLFVEAGAGTGKTASLVSRILTVVRNMRGGVARNGKSSYIVAITFTEAAAQELSQRVREELSSVGLSSDVVVTTTIHSFAARILRSYGAFSDLPIGFQSLDGIAETAYLKESWSAAIKRLMDDELSSELLGHYYSLGASLYALRNIYEELHDHWERLLPVVRRDGIGGDARRDSLRESVAPMVAGLLSSLDGISQMVSGGACSDPEDNLYQYIEEVLLPLRDELRRCRDSDDIDGVLEVMSSALGKNSSGGGSFKASVSKTGKKTSWQEIDSVRGQCDAIKEQAESIATEAGSYVAGELLSMMSELVVEDAGKRVVQGRVTFHDLLVLARNLLRDNRGVRKRVREEYPYIFVDEFQDTDPLQAEIVGYIVSIDDTCDFSNVSPGSLFVVGDPRQSIYRFRRADVDLYKALLRNAMGGDTVGDSVVELRGTRSSNKQVVLKTNFRSVPQIIDLVNRLFVDVFDDEELSGDDLLAGRFDQHTESGAIADDASSESSPSHVYSIGDALPKGSHEGDNIAAVRRLSARDMAGCIGLMIEQRWPVYDRDGEEMPIRFRDIAILLPRRTSVESIEKEFLKSGIPYHLEGTGSAWSSDEVFDIISVLRAAANPHDPLAVVSALRSPLIGCSDEEVYLWYASGRRWSLFAEPGGIVGEMQEMHDDVTGKRDFLAHIEGGMGILRQLVDMSMSGSVSALIRYILFDLGMLAAYTGSRRSRESVALLRWFVSRAVEFDDASMGGIADFISFVDDQALLEDRSALKIPQDDDDDAVRIMTVHGAKGLEFSAVFVAGIDGGSTNTGQPPVLFDSNGMASAKAGRVKSEGFDDLAKMENQADIEESRRLLYVACTRARDYLIFMLHHKEGSNKDTCYAALLYEWFNEHPEFKSDFPAVGDNGKMPDGDGRAGGTEGVLAEQPAGDLVGDAAGEFVGEFADDAVGIGSLNDCNGTSKDTVGGIADELVGRIAAFAEEKQELSRRIKDNLRYVVTPTAIQEWLERDYPIHTVAGAPSFRAKGGTHSREESQLLGNAVHKVLEQLDLKAVLPVMRDYDAMGDPQQKDAMDFMVGRVARSYHIEDLVGEVRRMVVNALESSTVGLAATNCYRQELPVAVSLDSFLATLTHIAPTPPAPPTASATPTPLTAPTPPAPPAASATPTPLTAPTPPAPPTAPVAGRDNFSDISPYTGDSESSSHGIVQGTIDLLIESDDGLIIVDFKTETPKNGSIQAPIGHTLVPGDRPNEEPSQTSWDVPGDGQNETPDKTSQQDERDNHIYQLACYAGMAEAVAKKSVSKCVVVYLGGESPIERVIKGGELRQAMERIGRSMGERLNGGQSA